MSTSPEALRVSGVSAGYDEAVILREVSLAIAPGKVLALLGKNGMGKTTLLKTIMGYLPKRAGSVACFGADLTHAGAHRMAAARIAYAPQEQALFQDLSIRDNLRLGIARDRDFEARFAGIIETFPFLAERLAQRAGTLSGGEQKMLLIARALMARPALILIDEISEGLQPSVIERVGAALRHERDQHGTAMLMVEQNVGFALDVADDYAVLKLGEIVAAGPVADGDAAAVIHRQLMV